MGELSGFSERVKGVAIFQPLLELKNLRKYEDFDLFSLGFSGLSVLMSSLSVSSSVFTLGLGSSKTSARRPPSIN